MVRRWWHILGRSSPSCENCVFNQRIIFWEVWSSSMHVHADWNKEIKEWICFLVLFSLCILLFIFLKNGAKSSCSPARRRIVYLLSGILQCFCVPTKSFYHSTLVRYLNEERTFVACTTVWKKSPCCRSPNDLITVWSIIFIITIC